MKKERQKMIAEEIKHKNFEEIQKQKEKGLEHVDFRKREQEAKEKARKDENKAERERQKQLREQRRLDREKQLGLEMMENETLEEYRKRVKDTIEANEVKPIIAKGGVITPLSQVRPKSSQPMGAKQGILHSLEKFEKYNNDLNQVIHNPSVRQNDISLNQNESVEDEQQKYLEQKRQREELLKEQKRKRREKQLEEQMKIELEKKKKDDAMNKLNQDLAKMKVENLKKQEESKKIRDEEERKKQIEKELKIQERRQKLGFGKKGVDQGELNRKEQALELHEWIEEQIKRESEKPRHDDNLDSDMASPPRIKDIKVSAKKDQLKLSTASNLYHKQNNSATLKQSKGFEQVHNSSGMDLDDIVGLDEIGSGELHVYNENFNPNSMVPGNNELDYQEYNKLGYRQNRYGLFGDNGYQEAIEIKKRPKAEIVQVKESSQDQGKILSNQGITSAMQKIDQFYKSKLDKHVQKHQELSFTDVGMFNQSDNGKRERRILNEIHKQYLLNFPQQNDEQIVDTTKVPGIVNLQDEIDRQKKEDELKQKKAVLVIQKWTRGALARMKTRKIRDRRQKDIEAQYGYFEDRVKFNSDYYLKKFIRDKQVLREMNKSAKIYESESIVERIEMSQSINQRVPIMSKVAGNSQSLGRGSKQPLLNNFIAPTPAPNYDPFSIINIMVNRQIPPKQVNQQSPVKLDRSAKHQPVQPQQSLSRSRERQQPTTQKSSSIRKQEHQQQKSKQNQRDDKVERKDSHSSDIVEEIFSEDIPKNDEDSLSRKSSHDSIVDEVGSHKGGVSSESHSKEQLREQLNPLKQSFQQLRNHKPFNYRLQESISESIQEDIIMSVDNRRQSPSKKNAESYERHDSSSIAEESHLIQGSASRASSAQHKKYGSAIEESINESVPSGSGHNSESSSMIIPKKVPMIPQKSQHEIEREKTLQQIKEFEEKKKADSEKKQQLISEMLHELNRYESATVSQVVVERMEKVITKSLAKNDQLFLAQRLHELELEKQHNAEIAKIREEQLKLFAQILLAGGQGSNGAANILSEKERKEMMENLQKIMDKPIVIQSQQIYQPSSSNNNSSSLNQSRSGGEESSKLKHSTSQSIKLDIVEESGLERDHSSQSSKIDEEIPEEVSHNDHESSEEIKESVHQIEESNIPEDSQLAKVRKVIGSEKDIRNQSKKAIKEESFQKNASGLFNKNSFNEFQEKKFREFLSDGNDQLFNQIERQLDQFKFQAQKDLDLDLKKNLITPRSYRKKGEEIEKWADNKKRELQKQLEPLNLHLKSIYDNLQKDKQSIIDKIGVSPRLIDRKDSILSKRKDESSIDYEEVEEEQSDESINTKYVRDQITKLAKRGDSFNQDPLEASESAKFELKIKKKKALAKKLLEEKERVINQGLKDKVRQIEADQAEKMVALALKLDPNQEIEKRLRELKRNVEESSDNNLESARSFNASQSGAPSESMSKKKVQFASPDKYRSSGVDDASSVSNRYSSKKFDESIGEDISIEDSMNPSSMPSQHTQSIPANQSSSSFSEQNRKAVNGTPTFLKPDSIKEDIGESIASSHQYSEDFEESKSHNFTPNRQRLSNYDRSATESGQVDEDYSQNFAESVDESKKIIPFNNGKHIEVTDTDGNPSQVMSSENPAIDTQTQSGLEVPVEKTYSEFDSTTNQQLPGIDQESEDQEVVVSSNSIQWEVDLKQQNKSSSDSYKEDFVSEHIPSDESHPKSEIPPMQPEPSSDEDDQEIQRLADAFTEEYIDILMKEIEESDQYVIAQTIDEDLYKNKFPFNQKEEEPDQPAPRAVANSPSPKPVEKKISPEEIARQKYEADLKKVQETHQENLRFIELMIEMIDRDDLIAQLEKPIEIDPLKKLAQIFSQEVDDSAANNETVNDSLLLNLDFYRKLENAYRAKYPVVVADGQEDKNFRDIQGFLYKSLFDAFNQALDIERPYKDKGQPAPWSKQTRVVKKKITLAHVEQIIAKSKQRVISWYTTGAGTQLAPPPPGSKQDPSHDDPNPAHQMIPPEEDRRKALQEMRLGLLMVRELEENENKWVDYEDEDTQVKFDLADMVLDVLANEVAEWLYKK